MVGFLHAALAGLIVLASALMWGGMSSDTSGIGFMGLVGLEMMLVPLAGALLVGLLFRGAGRGDTMLRTADVASIVVGLVGLSSAAGSVQWLIAVAIVTLGSAGCLLTFLEPAPRRGGWRSH
jgi:hypothetical protein